MLKFKRNYSVFISSYLFLFSFAIVSQPAQDPKSVLNLISPFETSVPNVSIPNTHIVGFDQDQNAKILRGMRPRSYEQIKELKALGITDVMILKDDAHGDVSQEIEWLKKEGMNPIYLPFDWKGYTDYKGLCNISHEIFSHFEKVINDPSRKLFFHCTVGEDRTGFLTGLYKVLYESKSPKYAFDNSMCLNGYSAGNPQKPKAEVIDKIQLSLTPIYIAMAHQIQKDQKFNSKTCQQLSDQNPQNFWKEYPHLEKSYTCKPSPLYIHK